MVHRVPNRRDLVAGKHPTSEKSPKPYGAYGVVENLMIIQSSLIRAYEGLIRELWQIIRFQPPHKAHKAFDFFLMMIMAPVHSANQIFDGSLVRLQVLQTRYGVFRILLIKAGVTFGNLGLILPKLQG